ncbi:MAG: hypothetical protein FWK04_29865 [Nostoc sp. GBBB01]|nr:hypothetical protein [Nostoc sp. GBBB01]
MGHGAWGIGQAGSVGGVGGVGGCGRNLSPHTPHTPPSFHLSIFPSPLSPRRCHFLRLYPASICFNQID